MCIALKQFDPELCARTDYKVSLTMIANFNWHVFVQVQVRHHHHNVYRLPGIEQDRMDIYITSGVVNCFSCALDTMGDVNW